jgi:hypothetical protein
VATCEERTVGPCIDGADEPGLGDWLGHLRCLEAFTHAPGFTCLGFYSFMLDEDIGCAIRGTLPVSSACTGYGQCASGVCSRDPATCLQCVPEPARANLGESCAGGIPCASATRCELAADGRALCMMIAAEGESCDGKACPHWYQNCKTGKCVVLGQPGDPCETFRDCVLDAWCDPATHLCARAPVMKPGEECGAYPADATSSTWCTFGTRCVFDEATSRATCRPGNKLGEACARDSECDRGLVCGDASTCIERPECESL